MVDNLKIGAAITSSAAAFGRKQTHVDFELNCLLLTRSGHPP